MVIFKAKNTYLNIITIRYVFYFSYNTMLANYKA